MATVVSYTSYFRTGDPEWDVKLEAVRVKLLPSDDMSDRIAIDLVEESLAMVGELNDSMKERRV